MRIVAILLAIAGTAICWPARAHPPAADICENNYIFNVNNLRNSHDIEMPVLANGHIAFVPDGNSIYMNGVYNGFMGESHRARIPNLAQIQFEPCGWMNAAPECTYTVDMRRAVFAISTDFTDGGVTVEQIQYAHRHFDRAIVNQITIRRNAVDTNGESNI